MRKTIITSSVAETEAVGKKIAEVLLAHGERHAFLALYGEMGVGKTAFTRGFASALGIRSVKSPTYTLVNEYRGNVPPYAVYHFDLCRITSEDDLYSIGFDDYIERDGFCLSEWSEVAKDALPREHFSISITRVPENDEKRSVTVEIPEVLDAFFSSLTF